MVPATLEKCGSCSRSYTSPRYTRRGILNLRSHKNVHTNVHGSIIHNSQRSENPNVQMINETWHTHTREHWVTERNEVLLNATLWKSPKNYAEWNKTDAKGQTYDSAYVRHRGQASPRRRSGRVAGVTGHWGRGAASYSSMGRASTWDDDECCRWLHNTVNLRESLNCTLQAHDFGMWMTF